MMDNFMSSIDITVQGEFITPKIVDERQILAALQSTGAGFEALGGSSLMLTEPIENSADSILAANRRRGAGSSKPGKGRIRILIDRREERVIIVDNGLGFTDPRHNAEKPFDSLKKYEPELTGKFARGLQGFRSYCEELTFISRRAKVPSDESFNGVCGKTIRLSFRADKIQVAAEIVPDSEFMKWSWGDFDHGAAAFYTCWKRGEFAKVRKEKLIKRVERHFGELIEKGELEIMVWEGKNLKDGKPIPLGEFYVCAPKDYSQLTKIEIEPVPYVVDGQVKGEIVFELHLLPGPKTDKDCRPFLMYRNRPVGDNPISLIGEFSETDVWNSAYLTGFIRADFCEINELRLALKPGPARDFLYEQLSGIEGRLRDAIKSHQLGLMDMRKSREVNQMVNKLQTFLKKRDVFDFKPAKEPDPVLGRKPRDAGGIGADICGKAGGPASMAARREGHGNQAYAAGVRSRTISSNRPGDFVTEGETSSGDSGSCVRGNVGENGSKVGFFTTSDSTVNAQASNRKPRGFNIATEEDEFSDELSSFDPVTSTIIINSAHERFKKRDDSGEVNNKELLTYLAELYIWEICKLAGQKNPEFNVMENFLKMKYEFFEKSNS